MSGKNEFYGVSIEDIKVLDFKTNKDGYNHSHKGKGINLGLNIGVGLKPEKGYLSIILDLNFTQNELVLTEFSLESIFKIIGSKIKKNKNKISIPDELLDSLIKISFGNARGIWFDRLQNTQYSSLILPLLTNNLIRDVVKKLEIEEANPTSAE